MKNASQFLYWGIARLLLLGCVAAGVLSDSQPLQILLMIVISVDLLFGLVAFRQDVLETIIQNPRPSAVRTADLVLYVGVIAALIWNHWYFFAALHVISLVFFVKIQAMADAIRRQRQIAGATRIIARLAALKEDREPQQGFSV